MITLGLAGIMIVSYGFIGSLTWILVPMLVHAVVDAVSMPASQLAVGTASGETAIAAGQGLLGATGLIIAAISSVGGGFVYQEWGMTVVWPMVTLLMALCLAFAYIRGKRGDWQAKVEPDPA